jgi:hypothetical protein
MKTISSAHYVLGICAAAIILAGCGGTTQLPNPVAQTSLGGSGTAFGVASPSFATPQRAGPDFSATELLTGTAKLKCRDDSGIPTTSFRASGKATGPYPGTFTAEGGGGSITHYRG